MDDRLQALARWFDSNGFEGCGDAIREWDGRDRARLLQDLALSVEEGWRNVGEDREVYIEAHRRIVEAR